MTLKSIGTWLSLALSIAFLGYLVKFSGPPMRYVFAVPLVIIVSLTLYAAVASFWIRNGRKGNSQ